MSNRIDLLHPRELDEGDACAWSRLQQETPAFSSPLLGPQFARAVGAVRDDARVAIWRSNDAASGFLAFHRRPSAFGRPIGAPFCDLHGLVAGPDSRIDGGALLDSAGLRALKVDGLIDPYNHMTGGHQSEAFSHRIALDGNAEAYLDRVRAQSRNGAKNFKRYSARMGQDLGDLRLAGPDLDKSALERLLAWKSAQLRASGLHDFLAVAWIKTLLHRLFDLRQSGVNPGKGT